MWNEGKRNGLGKYWFKNGNIFDGMWVDGSRTGHGTFTWGDGDYFGMNNNVSFVLTTFLLLLLLQWDIF